MNVLSHYSHVRLFVTQWTVAARLLSPWNSLGKITGVDSHSRGSSWHRNQTGVSRTVSRFFTTEPPGKPQINKLSHKQSHFWNLEKMKQVSFKCSETMNTVFIHRTNNKNISIQFYSVRRRKQRTRENWISSDLAWMQMPGSRNGREASWGRGHRNKSLSDRPT